MRKKRILLACCVAAGVFALAGALGLAWQMFDNFFIPSTALLSKGEIIISNFQTNHGFLAQSNEGSQSDDTTDFAIGEQSLRLITEGNGMPVFTRKSSILPNLNFTDRVLKIWIKVDDIDNVSELRISITGDGFRTFRDYWIAGDAAASAGFLRNNQWNVITLSASQARDTGQVDVTKVDSVQIRATDKGTGKPLIVWINSMSLVGRNERGIVTFAFDDGYETDYDNARPVLDKYHFPATSYVITSMVGLPGRSTLDQLESLQELNGWDIASHSYSHMNLTSAPGSQLESELSLSKQFLLNNGFQKGADHLAYPFGEFNNDELDRLVREYYKTARTADGAVETLPPSDPYRLRAVVVSNSTTPAEVAQHVQNAISNGDWLVLVFHSIVDSEAPTSTEYLQADFEAIVDDVASRGIDVMTVSEVYDNRYR